MDLFPTSMAKCPLNLTSLHRRDAAMCLTLTPGLLAANHLQQHHPKGIDIYCSTIFLLSTHKFRCYGICPSYICNWLGVCKYAHIDKDCQPSDIIDFWCNEINGTNNRSVTHSWQHEFKSPTVSQRFFKCFSKWEEFEWILHQYARFRFSYTLSFKDALTSCPIAAPGTRCLEGSGESQIADHNITTISSKTTGMNPL